MWSLQDHVHTKKKKRVFLLTLQFDWLPQKDDAYPRKILINGEKVVAFFKLRMFGNAVAAMAVFLKNLNFFFY